MRVSTSSPPTEVPARLGKGRLLGPPLRSGSAQALHRGFLVADAATEVKFKVELSPLVTYAGEVLALIKGKALWRSGLANSMEDLEELA
ncbi:hypothetical protein EI94DRAFT_643004 [Lactarius quietus]|nr:hypothetical protein EI94DRAFT_643004 [Lactarius quietus]